MRPLRLLNVTQAVVGFDEADNWIAERATQGDMVVTNDIPLAVNPARHVFTEQNIGTALSMRRPERHLRETGESKGYNASFSKKDRSQFLQSLGRLAQKER